MSLTTIRVDDRERPRLERIAKLLDHFDSYSDLRAVCLLGLSDDVVPSAFSWLANKYPLSAGATTRQLFTYAASKLGKDHLDRELRDAVWPRLRELGIVERAYALTKREALIARRGFEYGTHPRAKSPNNAYALTVDARRLIVVDVADVAWEQELQTFEDETEQRQLRALQQEFSTKITSSHSELIQASVQALRETILSESTLIFIDDADGERVKEEWEQALGKRGLLLELDTLWPDAILVNDADRTLWFVDAVTSDGEVDESRRSELSEWAASRGYRVQGFTTAYSTWKRAAERQGKMKNAAVSTTIWIAEDGGKLFRVGSLVRPE